MKKGRQEEWKEGSKGKGKGKGEGKEKKEKYYKQKEKRGRGDKRQEGRTGRKKGK